MIKDYTVTRTLHTSPQTIVYEAVAENGERVAIKTVADISDSMASNKLHREFAIGQLFSDGFTPRFIELIENEKIYLVQSYESGKTLSDVLGRGSMDLETFLAYAQSLCSALAYVHQKNILHLDLNPTNILCDENRKSVKLLDFGESISYLHLNKYSKKTVQIIGCAAYSSPEQTGLSNQSIDVRSDLYALGIIFYEMLSGRRPFEGDDKMQIVHSHLAEIPKDLVQINPDIPVSLSRIVSKLLMKDKLKRYQHATTLLYDLEQYAKDPAATFKLGTQDITDKLIIPQKLYGRDSELSLIRRELLSLSGTEAKLLMIKGYSGIGKSSFINEFTPIILSQNGLFFKGKFDQYNAGASYDAFNQIVNHIINMFNTMSSHERQHRIAKLAYLLGDSRYALSKIFPLLKPLFAIEQIPVIDPSQIKNQLFIAIERFFGYFATREQPLVIFLDDMQWADLASLEILEHIFSTGTLKNFALIGAYRSNEVTPVHPMTLAIRNIVKKIGSLFEIELPPLKIDAVKTLLRETLGTEDVSALGALLIQKTEGNPFFLKQFLYTLEKRGLLRFNTARATWEWDIDKINQESLTSNVIDHLIAKIGTMSPDAQTFIKSASVIGDTFDMETLSSLNGFERTQAADIINEVYSEGLIEGNSLDSMAGLYVAQTYRFIHDKIRQASYLMLNESEKRQWHLKIVDAFLSQPTHFDSEILAAAKHAVEVVATIETARHPELLHVLKRAAYLATESLAYAEAQQYVSMAISMLPENSWIQQYKTTVSLYLNLLEVLCHTRQDDDAAALFRSLLENDFLSPIDRARVYNLQLSFHFVQGMLPDAIEDGRFALQILGQEIPDDPSELLHVKQTELEWLALHVTSIEALKDLPDMDDEATELCMAILVNMGIPAFVSRQDIFAVVAFKMARLSIEHGNCSVSSYGYMLCGMILGAGLNQFEDGYRYGQIAIALQEHFDNKSIKCKLLRVYGAYVASWKQPHEETLAILNKAYASGIESGDFSYASYCVNHIFTREFLTGVPMDLLESKTQSYLGFIQDSKEQSILDLQNLLVNIPRCLRGNTSALNSLSSVDFDEQQAIAYFKKINYKTILAYYNIYKLQLCYIHEYYEEALEYAMASIDFLGNLKGNVLESEWVFYYAMTLFRRARTHTLSESDRELLKDFEERFAIWAELSADNFQSKHLLIKGANAYLAMRHDDAFAAFDLALNLQDTIAPTLTKAITLELISTCWNNQNNWRIGRMYLQEAYNIYYDLKAIAKAKLLFYSQEKLFNQDVKNITTMPTQQNSSDLNIFDEETIVKATQLISGNVDRSELISKFTQIIAQSFGIQTGALILKENDRFYLEGLFNINSDPKIVVQHQLLEHSGIIPKSIIHYILSEKQTLIIDDAFSDSRFEMDPIVIDRKIVSVICTPIFLKDEMIGIVYMENNMIRGFFDNTREKVLNILLTQTAVTLELENLYSHDKLTGCFSRQKLDEVLVKNDYKALLLINIAALDSINSTYGYEIGDEVLKLFVKFLHAMIETGNTLYRLSSDEFIIIINSRSALDAETLAATIINVLLDKKFAVGNFMIHLTCTIGITGNNDENASESALVRAHAAMKEARQKGTNKFMTYSADSLFIKKQKSNLEWMLKVKDAIEHDRFVPYFQPIIDNKTKQIIKYECLARLIENDTIIAPVHFIEPARLVGLLPTITQIMLTKSFQYFQNSPHAFSINISEDDLKEKHLPQLLQKLSKEYDIAPQRVTLEILENISAQESNASIEQLQELKKLGYKIALDDFGSEQSNFMRLQKMNVDYLKIDGSYIKNIHENPNNLNICKTIVHLAKSLHCEVIAEFVHSEDVYEVVKEIGIQYSQGYYFGQPDKRI